MTKQEAARKYPKNDARYMLCSNTTDLCVDAQLSNSGVGRFANTARGSKKSNNSKYTDRSLNIKSKQKIKAGTEITIAYGSGHTILQPWSSQGPTKVGILAGATKEAVNSKHIRAVLDKRKIRPAGST